MFRIIAEMQSPMRTSTWKVIQARFADLPAGFSRFGLNHCVIISIITVDIHF